MILNLTRGDSSLRVPLKLPATVGEIGEAWAKLDTISDDVSSTHIASVLSPVENLYNYIKDCDVNDREAMEKLNTLAIGIDGMVRTDHEIFAVALTASVINGIDDVIRTSMRLNDYVYINGVTCDHELGEFLVLTGYKSFPDEVKPYLDYDRIGVEYRTERGGAFTAHGYAVLKTAAQEAVREAEKPKRDPVIRVHLAASGMKQLGTESYPLDLPATEDGIERAKAELNIDYFSEATITDIEYFPSRLGDLMPAADLDIDILDDLARSLEKIRKDPQELKVLLAALSVERPETIREAKHIAESVSDYELVDGDAGDYARDRLMDLGAGDDILDSIELYMDFDAYGAAMMEEDGVRETEFGKIKRISSPFDEPDQGMEMQGF